MRIVGCFLEYDGRFVILRRHSHKPNGDTWGLPAGKVEPDEKDEVAVLRELWEETGYKARPEQLERLGDFKFNEGNDHYTFATYRIKLDKPHEVTIENTAHSEYKWVTPTECYALPNLIPNFHKLLKLLGLVHSL